MKLVRICLSHSSKFDIDAFSGSKCPCCNAELKLACNCIFIGGVDLGDVAKFKQSSSKLHSPATKHNAVADNEFKQIIDDWVLLAHEENDTQKLEILRQSDANARRANQTLYDYLLGQFLRQPQAVMTANGDEPPCGKCPSCRLSQWLQKHIEVI